MGHGPDLSQTTLPRDVGNNDRVRIEQILINLKCLYNCSDDGEVDDRISDLFSLLSLEERTELLYKSQSSPPLEQMYLFDKVASNPSLIGATDKEMTILALKKLQLDLISFSVAKGHLAHKTVSCLASKVAIQNLQKDGRVHLNELSRLLEKRTLYFDEVTETISLLKQVTTKCIKVLPKYSELCNQLEKISELQDLIRLLETNPTQMK